MKADLLEMHVAVAAVSAVHHDVSDGVAVDKAGDEDCLGQHGRVETSRVVLVFRSFRQRSRELGYVGSRSELPT
jgi:hypothetical protein